MRHSISWLTKKILFAFTIWSKILVGFSFIHEYEKGRAERGGKVKHLRNMYVFVWHNCNLKELELSHRQVNLGRVCSKRNGG